MQARSNPFQASNPARAFSRKLVTKWARKGARLGLYTHEPAVYPEVPATYPNRAVRRAVQQGNLQRLPGEWREFMFRHPHLRNLLGYPRQSELPRTC